MSSFCTIWLAEVSQYRIFVHHESETLSCTDEIDWTVRNDEALLVGKAME